MSIFLPAYSIYVPDCGKTAIRSHFSQSEQVCGIHMMDVSDALLEVGSRGYTGLLRTYKASLENGIFHFYLQFNRALSVAAPIEKAV